MKPPPQTAHPPFHHPEIRWMANGQAVLHGKVLDYFLRLDARFQAWAEEYAAVAFAFPTFIPASELARLDYFKNFPHLVTFPVTLADNEATLERFSQEGWDGTTIQLSDTAPIQDVLTPAACYHFYIHLQGQALPQARYLTTRATCFRREHHYLPLQRQWSFAMRELVCLGTSEEVQAFLDAMRLKLTDFFQTIDLPIHWEVATDPFFKPAQNPKFLMQKLDPVKHEMIFPNDTEPGKSGLAIGSINFHRNYFGETFDIQRNGKPAFSGCVAFGLERWLYAFLQQYGPEVQHWPSLEARP